MSGMVFSFSVDRNERRVLPQRGGQPRYLRPAAPSYMKNAYTPHG